MSSTETKTCSITEDEIKSLIIVYANQINEDNIEETLERMNYLNRRLKAEPKNNTSNVPALPEAQPTTEESKAASW